MTLAPQHEDRGDQEEDTEQHYDPVAAAAEAWGDDGTQPVRYDPIAAAAEGWGDDGTQPVCDDPVAEAQEGWGDDGSQPVHYDPLAEAQEGWGDDDSPPVTEVPATNDETPAAEAPADTPEEEASPAATSLDNEAGQVTTEREKKIWEMHLDEKWWMHRLLRRRSEHGKEADDRERNWKRQVERWEDVGCIWASGMDASTMTQRSRWKLTDEGKERI